MSVKYVSAMPATAFAPGDQVVRYINGQPSYCTVISIMNENQLLIKAEQWPAGYAAPVPMRDVALVARPSQLGGFAV